MKQVTAIVMAGGKGKRMGAEEEKPLIKMNGKPVVEHVLTALQNAKRVGKIVVAVSTSTPRTAGFVKKFPVIVLETPGKGYIQDMQFAVKNLGLKAVLAVASDLPLITSKIVDDVLERYEACGKPALTVAVPIETKTQFGVGVEYAFEVDGRMVVPTGVNVIDGRLIDDGWMDQEVYVLDKNEVAINVNTLDDLQLAERLCTSAIE